MKNLTPFALMLGLGITVVHGQERSIKMTFSGTGGASAINLQQPNTSTAEDNFAGSGSLGQFTFRDLRAIANAPTSSLTCSGPTQVFFASAAGAGVFRFQDGSLLKLKMTEGGDCIDFVAGVANCTVKFQVIGGTGRFAGATGTITLTETVVPVAADGTGNPVFFASTGEFSGTLSGTAGSQEQQRE